ncbi:GntR family transcriptional regulator [Leifsonia sp. 2MCAF36]|uniref:GntR family transcriptional regulator n=1 Tax=Leifsonia sp. 2MCAF36 TaxID=3232988 RepID=UPI003F9ACDBB
MIEPDAERVPLYQLVASEIADSIVAGRYPEGTLAPSANVCAGAFGMNPATAARGLRLLVARGVLQPQRGVGMRIAHGAAALILAERRESFASRRVVPLVVEARALGFTTASVLALVVRYAERFGLPTDRTPIA